MGDGVTISNAESLYFSWKFAGLTSDKLQNLNTVISAVDISGVELSTAGLLADAKDLARTMASEATTLNAKVNNVKDAFLKADASLSALFSELDKELVDMYGNYFALAGVNEEPVLGMFYNQYDGQYDNIKYGGGTLATDGCGFFSVLSVITAKLGKKFDVGEITELAGAVEAAADGKSNTEKMEVLMGILSEQYGFTYKNEKSWNLNDLTKSLSGGQAVIAMAPNSSSNSGHIVPLTGILENGNVVINDTYIGQNYTGANINRYDKYGFNLEKGEFTLTPGNVWYITFDNTKNTAENLSYTDVSSKKVAYDGVYNIPLYDQMDYQPEYGTGLCGPTTLAMLASYIRNETITPADIVAKYHKYNAEDGYSWSLFDTAAPELGLDVVAKLNGGVVADFEKAIELLKQGYVAAINVRSSENVKNIFTGGGHYMVVTGIDSNGKIHVNDPYGINYDDAFLAEGFKNGFDQKYFNTASGTTEWWFYDPNANGEVVKLDNLSTPTTEPSKPVTETPKPTTQPLEPVTETPKPTTEPSKPVTETPKPTTQPSEPVTETPKPTTQPSEPVTETPKPTTQPSEPVTETPKPTTQPLEPVTETPKPTTEPSKPVTETPKPTTQPLEPVTETPKPTTEPSKPVTETPKPTTQPSEPVTETPKPTTQPLEPVTETPKPTTEPSKPVTETPKPTTPDNDVSNSLNDNSSFINEQTGTHIGNSQKSNSGKIVGGVITGLLGSIAAFFAAKFAKKRQKPNNDEDDYDDEDDF